MAYNTELEKRIDASSLGWDPVKKNMFGGIGYMVQGNLAFGIHKDELIVRASEDTATELLKRPGIRLFDMTGRPMKNWLMAAPEAFRTDEQLLALLQTGYKFAKSLPPK